MREMRDAGVYGTIIVGDQFSSIERELLPGRRVLLHSLSGNTKAIAGILEVQSSLSLPAHRLSVIPDLIDEYEIRSLTVIDGKESDFSGLLRYFDVENLTAGGLSSGGGKKYWEYVSSHACVFV